METKNDPRSRLKNCQKYPKSAKNSYCKKYHTYSISLSNKKYFYKNEKLSKISKKCKKFIL